MSAALDAAPAGMLAVLKGRRRAARAAPESPRRSSKKRSDSPNAVLEEKKIDWASIPKSPELTSKDMKRVASGGSLDAQENCFFSCSAMACPSSSDAGVNAGLDKWANLRVDAHRGRWPKNAIKAASDAELIDACTPPAYAKSSTPDPYA